MMTKLQQYKGALERIALLDEADGHELTVKHAFEAVGIATSTLGKHPSEIHDKQEVYAVAMRDPTSRGDEIASEVRRWYEQNRETWWERHRPRAFWRLGAADNFMLGLVEEVGRAAKKVDSDA